MPLATERQLHHEPDHAPPVAPSLDDDRGAARRASLAGLRREAAQLAPNPADATRLHDKADGLDFQALQVSVSLAGTQLRRATIEIEEQIRIPPSAGAGVSPQLDVIRATIDEMSTMMRALNMQFGSHEQYVGGGSDGLNSAYRTLYPELASLDLARGSFVDAVSHAAAHARSHGVALERDVQTIAFHFEWLEKKLDIKAATLKNRKTDARPEEVVFTDAVASNVAAVIAEVHAVTAGLAGNAPTLATDLANLRRHTGAVAALVAQTHDAKAIAKLRPRLREMVHALDSFEPKLAARPDLVGQLHSSEFLPNKRAIAAKAGT
jgi:hypothetical protein